MLFGAGHEFVGILQDALENHGRDEARALADSLQEPWPSAEDPGDRSVTVSDVPGSALANASTSVAVPV